MQKLAAIVLGLGMATLGCTSSTSSDGQGGSGTTGATGATNDAAVTSSAATTGVGGGLEGDQTITLTMDSFDVPAGAEVYKCQNFANPFGGGAAEVQAFESHMTQGSHHLLLFYKAGATDGPLTDCSGLEFAATPYSTQLPDDTVEFPDGVAALIPPTTGIRLQSHYLNTSSDVVNAHVEMTFHIAKSGTVTQHAGVLFVIEPNIHVAPHSTQTVTHDCHLPFAMNLLKASSHMHQHGTSFLATVSDQTVFQTTQWSDPKPAVFTPAMALAGGAPLHFECNFENDGDTTLTFGESAQTNEMCIFAGSFYPVPDDNVVTVDCN